MFARLTDLNKLLFYAIAFGLCLEVTALASHLGDRTPILAMFSPRAAVLLRLLAFTRDGYSNAGRQHWARGHKGLDGGGGSRVPSSHSTIGWGAGRDFH